MTSRLSVNLRRLRADSGLSQNAMAEAIGCTQSALSMWENGTRSPSVDAVVKIADHFDVSVDHLLGRDVPTKKDLQPWQLTYAQSEQILASVESVMYTSMVNHELGRQE